MTDRRWLLIDPIPCTGAITLSGASFFPDPSDSFDVNGDYCPNGDVNGRPSWVRTGADVDNTNNAIYWNSGTNQWEVYREATFIYSNPDGLLRPQDGSWVAVFAPDENQPVWSIRGDIVLRDFGMLQPAKFSEEEDRSVGLMANRQKLNSDIVFSGTDFDYFVAIERNTTRRCEELTIVRQWRCNGRWKEVWRGTFSTGSGAFDFDRCEFTVRPDVLDEYTCIMRAMNKKVNLMDVEPVTVSAVIIPPGIEFATCSTSPLSLCSLNYNAGAGWDLALEWFDPDAGQNLRLYWRERIITNCVAGSPVPPPGTGWILLYDNCDGAWPYGECDFYPLTGQSVYVRPPTIPYTFGTPTQNPDASCLFQAYAGSNYNGNPNGDVCTPNGGSMYVCLGNGDVTDYERGRTVLSCVEYILEKSGCDQVSVESDFFEWNPVGDAPGYVSGENYLTGEVNQMDQLVLLQKSDALDPAATNPATLGEMTLKEMLTLFSVAFRVFWKITENGDIRFEHWSFWTTPLGLSVATYATDAKTEPMAYAHLRSEIPRYERPKWAEALGLDFVGADIEYDSLCANSDDGQDVKEYNPGAFTTDLSFITSDPDAIGKQGFALLATAFDGANYNVILDQGAITLSFITNAPMSWANLERDFWQHDRFLPTGTMNRVPTEFLGFLPNIEQKGVFLKFCCDYVEYDSSERVATRLGGKLGNINAFVRRAEFDEATEGMTLTLRYAY